MGYYSGKIDSRVILSLSVKRASQLGLGARLGLGRDAIFRMIKPACELGLVKVWRCGRIPCYSLTNEGKAYASQLARELGKNEVQRLLTPKPSKGKRAPIRKLEGKNLADSLGL